MRNAIAALAISIMAAIGSMLGADPLITLLSIVVSVLKVAHAYDVHRRNMVPVKRNLYPYRLQIMR